MRIIHKICDDIVDRGQNDGILLPSHLPVTVACSVAVLLGGVIAQKLVNRLDDQMVRKLIYIMIGVSGVLNLVK